MLRARIRNSIRSFPLKPIGGGFTGLLDTYGGAAAAYSVRRLSSTYTGALIEVRRTVSAVTVTADVAFDSNNELSLDSEITVTGGSSSATNLGEFVAAAGYSDPDSLGSGQNAFVRTWYDQSGNGNNAQQTTTSAQPQIVSSGSVVLSGTRPAILFNNINYILNTPIINITSQRSYFCTVERIGSPFGNYHNIIIQNSSPFYQIYAPSTSFNFFDGSVKSTLISFDTSQQIIGLTQDLTNGYFYKNDGIDYTFTPNTTSINATFSFGKFASFLSGLNGKLSEIIIYPESKYSVKTNINTNINNYFSIY